ncbi:MAG: tyrosine-protein phosphatase [Gemmataceae bacterium]|nr:tyrosine-protein phosphatase [Gemmataceae bacterium]
MERKVLQLGSERIAAARAWLRSAWPGIAIGLFMLVVPFLYYRHSYSTHKRFHVVDAEKGVFRSGCLTAQGFEDVIRRYGIKTVLNLQDEATDPELPATYAASWLPGKRESESQLCKRLGAEMIYLFAGHLRLEEQIKSRSGEYLRPVEIEQLLEIFDNPKRYPILIHCKAGLHRTGVTVALYRQEFSGWSKELALRELKANGFGELGSTSANQYILDYILNYRPGIRRPPIAPTTSAKSPGAQP